MSTILSHADVQGVKDAVDAFAGQANSLAAELETAINTVRATNFIGDASDGYYEFYQKMVVPALTTNLTDPSNSLCASIKSIMDSISEQLLDTVDPQLGDSNRNPGA